MFKKYNIFYTEHIVTDQPFFRYPYNTTANGCTPYKNANGQQDLYLYPIGGSAVLPANTAKNDFVSNFSMSWTEQLLPHHSEYGRYKYAFDYLSPRYEWIDKFQKTTTYQNASDASHGYVYLGVSDNTHNTPINDLPTSITLDALPEKEVVVVYWDERAFKNFIKVVYQIDDNQKAEFKLKDISLIFNHAESDNEHYRLRLVSEYFQLPSFFLPIMILILLLNRKIYRTG